MANPATRMDVVTIKREEVVGPMWSFHRSQRQSKASVERSVWQAKGRPKDEDTNNMRVGIEEPIQSWIKNSRIETCRGRAQEGWRRGRRED